jgi:2,4-dienoyl-CoA reductase-like NADH-dependent reductase (Old Yellow Enzyme family)
LVTCSQQIRFNAEGATKLGADLVVAGRAVVAGPEWLSKVRSKSEPTILAGLPKDELEIASAFPREWWNTC